LRLLEGFKAVHRFAADQIDRHVIDATLWRKTLAARLIIVIRSLRHRERVIHGQSCNCQERACEEDACRECVREEGGGEKVGRLLSDGDAGLWRLQREALPNATIVLDWWHAAVRFEYALQAASGLGAADAHLAAEAVRGLVCAKWRLWYGRWPGCRRKLAALCCWARRT
jgi:hypothetical protein